MIILTFDDALLNTYTVAFPLMNKFNMKGVLFVPTDAVAGGKQLRKNELHMSVEQVQELHAAGWEIGSQSHTHPKFFELHIDQAKWELTFSKMQLEKWGFQPASFAFPYGHGMYNDEQVKLALQTYMYVRTVEDFHNPNRKLIHGLCLDHGYPPRFPFLGQLYTVYVLHAVKNPERFEEWLGTLHEPVITLKEAGDKVWGKSEKSC